ncbi:inositol monophosphatase family protein [Streptomyces sp. NPDC085942]|uniref:inositol monophosphatase family protein n=1 Tax=Streptomyces sp. NPDC085942 TaxID=3365743 RepID=UPI0037D0471F
MTELAVTAAREAGQILLRGAEEGPVRTSAKSSRTDLVTVFDRRSEDHIVGLLAAHRPDDGVLGEEGGERPGTSGVRWVIDPLDGTANYVARYPAFVVSVAVELNGVGVVGVVHDPSRQETFSAERGRGASLNGRALHVPHAAAGLADVLLSTGLSSDLAVRARQAALAARIACRVRDVRSSGSAALDLCWVAGGRLGAYYESDTRHWDRAAGALIASEAGAWVGDLDGGPASDRMVIACTPGVEQDLRTLLGHT